MFPTCRNFLFKIFVLCGLCRALSLAFEKPEPVADSLPQIRTEWEHGLSFSAVVLSHRALRHSKALHDWPFFAFAMPTSWTSNLKLGMEWSRILSAKGAVGGSLTLFGLGVKAGVRMELLHLLEVGVETNAGSAVNYGDICTFMGVFDPDKKDYTQDAFMTEFSYGVRYDAGISLPLVALLPKSKWTKIILRPTASLSYSAYTGASDGEVWKAGGMNMVNGYNYQYGGSLIYMLPFRHFPMAMVSFGVKGFLRESDFDDCYRAYDPGFKTVSVTPMLSLKLGEKWSGMLMAPISRDRRYRNYRYETGQELLQERIGSEWTLNAVILVLTRRF